MFHKVAVVTGSNKGIGYGIVKALCKRGVSIVYLTARDISRGTEALESLKREGLNPRFHQLDITDASSVKKFADYLRNKYGGVDILINNAGIACKDFNKTTYEDSEHVINVNYRSFYNIQDYLFPVLNDNARVINMSSDGGHLSNIKNEYWIQRLTSENLELKDIDEFVGWFLESVKNNTLNEEDFLTTMLLAYRISKVAICALTRVMQKNIGRGISVNSVYPGFVKTDMSKNLGTITVEEASETPVYLALDCDQSVKGKNFYFDKSEKEWSDTTLQLYFIGHTKEINKLLDTFE